MSNVKVIIRLEISELDREFLIQDEAQLTLPTGAQNWSANFFLAEQMARDFIAEALAGRQNWGTKGHRGAE